MSEHDALNAASQLLNTLIETARKGETIPSQLPDQLRAIQARLAQLAQPTPAQGASEAAPVTPAAAPETPAPTPAAPATEATIDPLSPEEQAAFFGHAIHELRTPMTSIRGYSDMLNNDAMGPLTAMQRQFVETIRKNSRRMETLMSDVADMNKIRAGTLRTTLKMDMFKNIAMMIEKSTMPLAESLGVTLTFDIPQGLPLLNTDGEMMAKAISKLVENALRYHSEEATGQQVTVQARNEDKMLVVTVHDNGIGMDPDELSQLGTVYFRADKDPVRAHKGSGLGIPVAYGILHQLGGTISVTSTPETGTTFSIRFPGMS